MTVNDKAVLTMPVDYPKFDKQATLTHGHLCHNFTGQLSTFILFTEPVSAKKFRQLFLDFPFGIQTNQNIRQLQSSDIITKKLHVFYCSIRSCRGMCYDIANQHDGELRTNSGVFCADNANDRIAASGGIRSLLPILKAMARVGDREVGRESVTEFLRLMHLVIRTKSYGDAEELSHFFKVFFHYLAGLPREFITPLCVHQLSELRLIIQDERVTEQFFQSLIFSADLWLHLASDFWGLVKTVYAVNPVHFNRVFGVEQLVDFMVRLSEQKDGICCDYHKLSLMQGQKGASRGLDQVVAQKVTNLEKLLTPIAAVIEFVLTNGGDAVLDQTEYLVSALVTKTPPCFRMQILKLLKILLLDSKEERFCASPVNFAAHFVAANGLQTLLYLCLNSPLDVKSMCIKLIDVLSSHTNLIKMRLDTELITYLCHVLLPKADLAASLTQASLAQLIKAPARFGRNSGGNVPIMEICEEEERLHTQEEEEAAAHTLGTTVRNVLEGGSSELEKEKAAFGGDTLMGELNAEDALRGSSGAQEEEPAALSMAPPAPKNRKGGGFNFMALDSGSEEEDKGERAEEEPPAFANPFFAAAPPPPPAPRRGAPMAFGSGLELDIEEPSFGAPPPPAPKNRGNPMSFLFAADEKKDDEADPKSFTFSKPALGAALQAEREEPREARAFQIESGGAPFQPPSLKRRAGGGGFQGGFTFNQPGLFFAEEEEKGEAEKEEDEERSGEELRRRTEEESEEKSSERTPLAATGATEQRSENTSRETSSERGEAFSFRPRAPAGRGLKCLSLDIDVINERFTFGGERGEDVERKNRSRAEVERDFLGEVEELAALCVAAQRRENPEDPIVGPEFEGEGGSGGEGAFGRSGRTPAGAVKKGARSNFMTPQSVRGIKKIEFASANREEEDEKEKESSAAQASSGTRAAMKLTHSTIVEEQSPMATSKSSSSRPDFGMQGNLTLEINNLGITQTDLTYINTYKGNNEVVMTIDCLETGSEDAQTNAEIESLYISTLEWILNRVPAELNSPLMIDETDQIQFPPAIGLFMCIVSHSRNTVKQRAFQDLLMLAKWNPENSALIVGHPLFVNWMLELLLPYQILSNQESLSGSSLAVWDMGCKLCTLLLKNFVLTDEKAHKKLCYLVRYPAVLRNGPLTLTEERRSPKRSPREVEAAEKLVRVLLAQLLACVADDAASCRPAPEFPVWHNLVHVGFFLEELVLTAGGGDFASTTASLRSTRRASPLFSGTLRAGSGVGGARAETLSGAQRNEWAELPLIDTFFTVLESLWPRSLYVHYKGDSSIRESILTILDRLTAEDFAKTIDVSAAL